MGNNVFIRTMELRWHKRIDLNYNTYVTTLQQKWVNELEEEKWVDLEITNE